MMTKASGAPVMARLDSVALQKAPKVGTIAERSPEGTAYTKG